MATIGSLVVRVSADDKGFHASMDRVARKAVSVGATLKKFGMGGVNLGGKIADQLSGNNITVALKSGIEGVSKTVQNLVGSIPGIGPLLSAAFGTAAGAVTTYISLVESAINLFKAGAEPIKELYAAAKRLGVSTEEMAGIMESAGGSSEALEKAMMRLGSTLGEAVLGSDEARLKFERVGLSWQKMAGMTKRDQLGATLDALKNMGDSAVGSAGRLALLGKSSFQLGGVIAKGNAGLVEGEARVRQYGQALSDVDALQVIQASKSLKIMGKVMAGVKEQAAIALAPVISGIADEFKTMGVDVEMVRDITLGAVKVMAYNAAGFIQVLDGIKIAWDSIVIATKLWAADSVDQIVNVLDVAAMLPDKIGGATFKKAAAEAHETSQNMWADLESDRKAFLERLAKPSAWTQVSRFFDNIENRINAAKKNGGKDAAAEAELQRMMELGRKVGDLQTKLDDQTSAYGRNSQLVEVNKLARQGATEAMLAGVRASIAEVDALNQISDRATSTLTIFDDYRAKVAQLKDAFAAGKISTQGFAGGMAKITDALDKGAAGKVAELFKSTRTPLENFQSKIEEIGELTRWGADNWDLYARGVGEAAKALGKTQETKLAGAAELGSQEAYGAINKAQQNAGDRGGLAGLQEAIKAQTELQKRQLKDLDDIAQAARRGLLAPGKIQ